MTSADIPTFGVIDYCLFASMLALSVAIGVVMSFKGNKTPDDYLLGSRSFKPIPVAMSLLTSIISAISILGFSGEAYAYGLQFSVIIPGIVVALIFCNFFILPVLFPLKLTSINEYIEMRFKSKLLRSFVLLLSSANGFMHAGLYLYAPTIALTSVTPYSTTTYIYLLGIVCTLYSAIGGIKAVVWTDVFQLTVVVIGLTVITILGCVNLGGIVNVWTIAIEGGRFDMFRMNFGLYGRTTFVNAFLHGFFFWMSLYGTSQINAQRMNCVKNINEAKFLLLSNIVGYLILYSLIFTSGIMCYATYVGCDPLHSKKITKIDQILTFFVIDKLGYIPGLPGLFVATIVGGSLSSVSSAISSQGSMMWVDGLSHFHVMGKATPQVAAIINKVLSLLVGSVIIAMALWSSSSESIIELAMVVLGGILGTVLGLYLLGFFFPTCNTKGAWCGLISSMVLMSWIAIGGALYRPKRTFLPLSIDSCPKSEEFTQSLRATTETFIYYGNSSNETINQKFEFPIMWLYGISPTLYIAIAPITCIIVGLIVSFATGSQNLSEVSPKLITPIVRKFFWTDDELNNMEKELQNELRILTKSTNDDCINGIIKNELGLSLLK